jgi:aminobenzoyl-glutamate utilization protein A
MSLSDGAAETLRALRRDLHRHPEPAWREFYTTARLVSELEERPLDELHVGPEALAGERRAVPDDDELASWRERALAAGAREDVVERLEDGQTGAVAVYRNGEGPTVGLRVDIDALPVTESTDDDHVPASEGFRSENEGYMHACGHDAHAAIGVGVLDAVVDGDFEGTLKVFFQPSEEKGAGGEPMAESPLIEDVDHLLAVHVGLDHPTGEVVAGISGFLAVSSFRAEFEGAPSHAGARPEEGKNAVQAMATAVSNLYAIPRHADGDTRINAGKVGGGTASNVVPEEAHVEGEVRGETTDLMEYMEERAHRVLEAAADMHDVDVDVEEGSRAPSAESDAELAAVVADVAGRTEGVDSVVDEAALGGSEDATYLMRAVQERGGLAAYVGVGTDNPGGHHTGTFDVEDDTLDIGVRVLAESVRELGRSPPAAE